MGNRNNIDENDRYFIHIQFIGQGLAQFKKKILSCKILNYIKNYWKFEYLEKNPSNSNQILSNKEQIDKYFDILEKKKIQQIFNQKEVLIIKVKNIFDPEINYIFNKMNKLEEIYFMPILLILYEGESEKKNENKFLTDKYGKIELNLIKKEESEKKNENKFLNTDEYENIEPRLIKKEKYSEDPIILEEKIAPILLRFCSIHNELGDKFTINNKEDFDLTTINYPFNLNIACIGQIGKGKSTGVNAILREYKAKESCKGTTETKFLTYYQVDNKPIRILDIPGFENEKTIKNAIEKFKFCREKLNKMRDNLHIILYFFQYNGMRAFIDLEYLMLDEILKHKGSKIIYVFTHSRPNLGEKNKKKEIQKINSGIIEMFDGKKKSLKIIDDDDDTQSENKSLKSEIEDNNIYKNLMATLDNTIFLNFHEDKQTGYKPFGEKELFKKICDFFVESDDYKNSNINLNQKIIEERAEKLRKEAEEIILSNKIWGGVVGLIPGVDWFLQKFVIKKNAAKKIGRVFGIAVKFVEEKEFKNTGKFAAEAVKAGSIITGIGIIAATTAEVASVGLRVVGGVALAGAGSLLGVGFGGFLTYKYCQNLLDEFVKYYKKNTRELENSYKLAEKYLLS